MQYPTDLNPQEANRDLALVRDAMGRAARVSSGDGFYFFIWGWTACLVMLLQRFFPGDLSLTLGLALYAAAIVLSGMVGQWQNSRGESNRRDLFYWLIIIAESTLFSALFIILSERGFNPEFLDVVNMMLFALGIITVGSFTDMRVAVVGFAEIVIAVLLPALLPNADDRIIAAALVTAAVYTLAGWFIYQTGRVNEVKS